MLTTENSLRSIAVRLYGIYVGDPDPLVRGCVATLINAVIPALERLEYTYFMQGTGSVVTLTDLRAAAGNASPNPDGFLARLVFGSQHEAGKMGQGM